MTTDVTTTNRIVTPDMLENLPESVQRYLTYCGVVGKPWINTVRLRYKGKFRLDADKPWMPMQVEQCYTTNPPGFDWDATFTVAGLPFMRGRDAYHDGHGHMVGKLLGLLTVIDAHGDELDQNTMLRYLNEMFWFPSAYLSQYVTWQGIDNHCAEATFTDRGKSVSARFFFDDVGRLLNFIARRCYENNGRSSLETWSTPMSTYGMRGGLNLPVRGQAMWNLPTGDFPYIDLELTEIDYNQAIKVS